MSGRLAGAAGYRRGRGRGGGGGGQRGAACESSLTRRRRRGRTFLVRGRPMNADPSDALGLARLLSCTVEALAGLRLCRTPGDGAAPPTVGPAVGAARQGLGKKWEARSCPAPGGA